MNKKTKSLALVAIAALLTGPTLSAQTVGYITKTIAAGSQGTFSVTFDSEPVSFTGQTSGIISAVGNNTLTLTGAGWATNFAATLPFYVKITSGSAEGRYYRIATTNSAETLNLTAFQSGTPNINTLGIVAGSDSFKIIKGETLQSFFANIDVFKNASATVADAVYVNNDGAWTGYFHNTTNWRRISGPTSNQNNTPISPEGGILYLRRAGTPVDIIYAGVVPNTKLKASINNVGTTLLSGSFPIDTQLNSLNIQSMPGWVSAATTSTTDRNNADKVFINNGSWTGYVYHSGGGTWVRATGPTGAQNPSITAGTPVLITRASGGIPSTVTTASRNLPY